MKCIISANDLVSISKLLAPNVDKEAVKEVILKVIAENDSNLNECLVVSRKLEAEIEMGFSGIKGLKRVLLLVVGLFIGNNIHTIPFKNFATKLPSS